MIALSWGKEQIDDEINLDNYVEGKVAFDDLVSSINDITSKNRVSGPEKLHQNRILRLQNPTNSRMPTKFLK